MDFPKISEHISFREATKSQTAIRLGIENIPNDKIFARMKILADMVFEPLRKWYGKPIGIASFYRSQKINDAIGGAKASQHCMGEAMDIDADIYNNGITNTQIFNYIRENLDFDQLIAEGENEDGTFGWVHVSYRTTPENRKQVLRIVFRDGKSITSIL
jgi:zinc D-Ala-D-Ala carboxypeptidase